MGSTQVNEVREIETPIMLRATVNVPRVADAVHERVRSVKVVMWAAIQGAKGGAVAEGAVGAGTGTHES